MLLTDLKYVSQVVGEANGAPEPIVPGTCHRLVHNCARKKKLNLCKHICFSMAHFITPYINTNSSEIVSGTLVVVCAGTGRDTGMAEVAA